MRFLLYSHDGLGLGHTSRNIAIAKSLARLVPGASILLATGTDDINRVGLPAQVEVLKLPGLRKVANDRYIARRLTISSKAIRTLRSRLLTSVVECFRPHVILADKHPLGAGGELREALEWHRAVGGRAALGFRDILDDPETVLAEWAPHRITDTIANFYDRLLIYGQQEVFDPIAAYHLPGEIQERTRFCGYVVNELPPSNPGEPVSTHAHGKPRVLATVGGGEDGRFLLESFLKAARDATWTAEVVTGPMLPPAELLRLRELASEAGAVLHGYVPDLRSWFNHVDALVCMGGYNTLAEAVSVEAPVLCVPRVQPRREQIIRAEAFERLGLLRLLHPVDAAPARLRTEIDQLLRLPRRPGCPGRTPLRMNGSHAAAAELCELVSPAAGQLVEFALERPLASASWAI